MEALTLVLVVIFLFCLAFYLLVSQMTPRRKAVTSSGRVLLVISHPDDEVMFFGPTILSMTEPNSQIELFLLCMSTGNYRHDGLMRKEELYKACKLLRIPEHNINVLSYTKLSDSPHARWREEIVSKVIVQMTYAYNIDVVLTFDRAGVSGHLNHCSLFNALVVAVLEKKLPTKVSVFVLRTVNRLRKYSFLLDVPMSYIFGSKVYICSPRQWMTLWKAMAAHQTQFVWFRKLYMLFSRYTLINTLDQLSISPATKN